MRTQTDKSPNNFEHGVACPQGARKNIIPKNKTQARFNYGNGAMGKLPKQKMPKKLTKVKSKIKD